MNSTWTEKHETLWTTTTKLKQQTTSTNFVNAKTLHLKISLTIALISLNQDLDDESTRMFYLTCVCAFTPLLRWDTQHGPLLEGSIPIGQCVIHMHIVLYLCSVSLPGDVQCFRIETCSMTHHWRVGGVVEKQRNIWGNWRRSKRKFMNLLKGNWQFLALLFEAVVWKWCSFN